MIGMSKGNASDPGNDTSPGKPQSGFRTLLGIFVGLSVFFVILLVEPPVGMQPAAWRTAAVACLMAIWWISEAVPVALTALLPIVLFPVLGILPVDATTAPYANPLIFLFMGGFIIALAMERWNLHRRIALSILMLTGSRQDALIGGFMVATAGLSMWVSNTATTVMMLPIAISVIPLVSKTSAPTPNQASSRDPFALALLLGIAYAASVGGLGTLIGTPPNALLAAFVLENYGYSIGFGQWMLIGLPLVAVMLLTVWTLLTKLLFPLKEVRIPGAADKIRRELAALGPMSRGEKIVAVTFAVTALLWVFRPLIDKELGLPLTDPSIAIGAALVLFLIPIDVKQGIYTMDWSWAQRLPWGVLILFGGGLSLAKAISSTDLAGWIGQSMSVFGAWNEAALVLLVVTVIIFLTELTSNTATAAAFLPVLAAVALSAGQNPLLLAVPAAIGASCAFMMPVATPPNAIVFGSGMVTIPQMARAGFLVNLAAIILIMVLTYTLILAVFGIHLGVIPDWATG